MVDTEVAQDLTVVDSAAETTTWAMATSINSRMEATAGHEEDQETTVVASDQTMVSSMETTTMDRMMEASDQEVDVVATATLVTIRDVVARTEAST